MTYQITGTTVINSGRCLTNIVNACSVGIGTSVFVIRDANCNIQTNKIKIILSSVTELSYGIEGGYLICKSGGLAWIVAPSSSNVLRAWANINDAVTTAQSITGCTGWFVPTITQLQNPGWVCRFYWDTYSSSYWSSTQSSATNAFYVYFGAAGTGTALAFGKTTTLFVRAFRCVTY